MAEMALLKLRPLSLVAQHFQLPSRTLTQWRLSDRNIPSPSRLSCCHFSGTPPSYPDLVVKVPPMAESISEGILAAFHKQVGDRIGADEELASIETDKIDVAVNVAEEEVITELFAQEEDVVTIGQQIARIETGPIDTMPREPRKQSSMEAKEDVTDHTQRVPAGGKGPTGRENTLERPTRAELQVTLLTDTQPDGFEQTSSSKYGHNQRPSCRNKWQSGDPTS
ncbi:dihydrolipoamide succinyltransferase [Fusarium sporotrichioides]|uniref:Dihydrolipoamide succinyltransferase n=1 Tax=Fusarium sporotrichioides TaxID=5514 RepID=A0A395RRL0_FUSSP|nr:dihydrolipoamide succinyltransferase [Fusarium sporotrichioides]